MKLISTNVIVIFILLIEISFLILFFTNLFLYNDVWLVYMYLSIFTAIIIVLFNIFSRLKTKRPSRCRYNILQKTIEIHINDAVTDLSDIKEILTEVISVARNKKLDVVFISPHLSRKGFEKVFEKRFGLSSKEYTISKPKGFETIDCWCADVFFRIKKIKRRGDYLKIVIHTSKM